MFDLEEFTVNRCLESKEKNALYKNYVNNFVLFSLISTAQRIQSSSHKLPALLEPTPGKYRDPDKNRASKDRRECVLQLGTTSRANRQGNLLDKS